MTEEWTDTIADEARRQFSKWDEAMWQTVLEGPAARLARRFGEAGWEVDDSRPILEAYLECAAEAIGLGYLYPVEETGRENFFNRAWFDLLPNQLPAFPAERQMELLAACWNLGENLETRPSWLQHLLLAESSVLETLEDFESRVAAATAEILGEPAGRLDDSGEIRTEWLHLGDYDSRFLPGAVEFLAPGVACVHHRHEDLDGHPKSSIGISLLGEPDVLGTMQVRDPDGATAGGDDPLWQQIAARDQRVTGICSTVRNAWRGVGTLHTSQFVVAVLPESTVAAEERGTHEGA